MSAKGWSDHLEERERTGYDHQDASSKHAKIQVDQAAKAFEHASATAGSWGKHGKKLFPYYKYRFYQKGGCSVQEDLEQRTVSVSIQAAKLSGRVLRAAIAAVLQKMEQEHTMPKSRAQQHEAADL